MKIFTITQTIRHLHVLFNQGKPGISILSLLNNKSHFFVSFSTTLLYSHITKTSADPKFSQTILHLLLSSPLLIKITQTGD